MGLYLNPGNDLFTETVGSQIYIDKTLMIKELNKLLRTSGKFVCISRPRRFGKTITSSMLAAYYSKGCYSKDLFNPFLISNEPDFEKHLNKYNVIQIDLNTFYKSSKNPENLIENITNSVNKELISVFPNVGINLEEDTLAAAMLKVWAETKEQFIFLMDEYDVLVREQVSNSLFENYLDFLSSLFKNSTLKPAIALAYLTGILPIVRDRIQSKMNEFDEYSMVYAGQFSDFVGFTEEESAKLCKEYGMDYDECRRWYDGYRLSDTVSVYSPKSMVSAMLSNEYGNYWTKTGSYEALSNYILMDFDGIKDDVIAMIAGKKVPVNVLTYLNTLSDFKSKHDVFTYLIHLGYLSYDRKNKECFIPNNEIRIEWINAIENAPEYKEIIEMVNGSKELLKRTIAKDEAYVAEALDKAHVRATNPLTYNNEASFQSAIGIAYFYATSQYTIIKELPSGKGYADLALIPYVPNIPAIIIELKNNKSAETALLQIKDRKYDDILQHYKGDMLFVGINYSSETKMHQCKIEEITY